MKPTSCSHATRAMAAWSIAMAAWSPGAEPTAQPSFLPDGDGHWELAWSDEFDYPDADLDKAWVSQNGPSGHILCSRWRENAQVGKGVLRLVNRKEQRGGQEWTSGSLTSKERFLYGYFECRYRYAAAAGTNNSFWLMTSGPNPTEGKRFEIDINEGHFPNALNTNIHNWSDITVDGTRKRHPSSSKSFRFGVRPDYRFQLEIPVTTRRVRLVSQHPSHFHIGEFRIYGVNPAGYPEALSPTADQDRPGLVNLARDPATTITVSGSLGTAAASNPRLAADGRIESSWVSQREGEKWIEFAFAEAKTVGCVQFLNGWKDGAHWKDLIDDYRIQYHDGQRWVDIATCDLKDGAVDFARDFHRYGLEWSRDELVFFFDGKEIRRVKNEFCWSPSPVWLSLAIIPWAGKVTDAIDGTAMEVDYVRVYRRR